MEIVCAAMEDRPAGWFFPLALADTALLSILAGR